MNIFIKLFSKIKYTTLFLFLGFFNYVFADVTPDKTLVPKERLQKATADLDKKTSSELIGDVLMVATRYITTILLGLIILMFLYGLMKYMFKGQSSDTARTEGRKLMFWGVIGIFVVTSWIALVAIVASLVGHDSITIPQFKF